MKEMKKYRKAPLSFGHLPEGERGGRRLPAGQAGKSEDQSSKREPGFDNLLNHCSNFLAPLSPSEKGDEISRWLSGLVAGSEGVVTPANVGKENNEHRIVLSAAEGIVNLLAANPDGAPRSVRVGTPDKPGKENNEYPIMNNESGSRKSGVRSQKSEARSPGGIFCFAGFHGTSPKREPGFDNLLNHCSNLLAPLSTSEKGDEISRWLSGLVAGSEGVVTPANVGKENPEYRISLSAAEGTVNLLAANPDGARSSVRVGTTDKSGTVSSKGRNNMLPDVIIQQQRPEATPGRVEIAPGIRKMTQGQVKTTPGIKKMTHGRVKTTPEFKKMIHGRLKIAPGLRKMTHGWVKTAPGRVEYAPGPLPAPHGTISPYAFTAPYGVGTPERPEMGLIKGRNKEHRITNNEYRISNNEGGSQKSEVRSSSGTPVSDFLFLISYFLFPGKGKENKEHRITNNEYRISNIEYRIRKAEDGIRNLTSNDTSTSFLSPSPFGEGRGEANIKSGSILGSNPVSYFLFPEKGKRPETTPGWVEIAPGIRKMTQGQVKTTPELKKMTHGRLKTTPGIKKMTHGRLKIASGIKKMTHGRVKTTPGRVEYAPGPLPAPHGTILPCAFTAAWYRVGTPNRPEMGLIKGENKEHRISNNEYRIRKAEDGSRNLTSNDTSTSFLSPSPFGEGRGEAKYKTLSRLPQESGFYSGDCPGAAAITINYSLFSSPRVSPIFAGFTQTNLPVPDSYRDNQTLHQGSFVPLENPVGIPSEGDEIRPLVAGSEGVKERRYAYVLN